MLEGSLGQVRIVDRFLNMEMLVAVPKAGIVGVYS